MSPVSIHKELTFEDEVCAELSHRGWLHSESDAQKYDRTRAVFPEDVLEWVHEAFPQVGIQLEKSHGGKAGDVLLDRLRHQLDQQGTLAVLRDGIELVGVKGRIRFAEFKPAFNINPDIVARYKANRLRVVRQVRYSLANEICIDLVLFLNGLPVATVELKTDFTQSIQDAIDQYRFDRLPKPKGSGVEPLLSFPAGALVHFAVSNSEVHMTTRLEGPATTFLPFNRGDHGGKGNPLDPVSGHRTAYLWREVWEREPGWRLSGATSSASATGKRFSSG